MILMIVADTYQEFYRYANKNFVYFRPGRSNEVVWVHRGNADNCRSVETGSLYIHLSDDIPEWFQQKFTQIQLVNP